MCVYDVKNSCLSHVFFPPSYFLFLFFILFIFYLRRYLAEILKKDRKYISARQSGPLKVFIFKRKSVQFFMLILQPSKKMTEG